MKFILLIFFSIVISFAAKIDIMLLDEYKNQDISGWLMSEKLDGVRAYWDGEKLISRNGNTFETPAWFIEKFPPFALDGELWSKQGDFEKILSIVSKKKPHEDWSYLKFHVFDAPEFDGGLLQRLNNIQTYQNTSKSDYLNIVEQIVCKDENHLNIFLKEVEAKGGEGVVIREGTGKYLAYRNQFSLKVKSFHDDECTITKVYSGKGRLKNQVGSFICELKNGKTFKIGSGISDEIRANGTLKKGVVVTFKYQNLTINEIPRFPVFLRIKKD